MMKNQVNSERLHKQSLFFFMHEKNLCHYSLDPNPLPFYNARAEGSDW